MNDTTNNNIKKDGTNMENLIDVTIDGGQIIGVDIYPTLEQKLSFVQAVVSDVDVDSTVYNTLVDARFDVYFLTVFTNYIFPDDTRDDEGKIDFVKAYNHIRNKDIRYHLRRFELSRGYFPLNTLITLLENDVKRIIEIENQKLISMFARNMALEDTLDSINMLVNKGIDFLNGAIVKVGSLSAESFADGITNISQNIMSFVETNATADVDK